jgi:hypothetical protein
MLELESKELGVGRVVESGSCVYITRCGVRSAGLYVQRTAASASIPLLCLPL